MNAYRHNLYSGPSHFSTLKKFDYPNILTFQSIIYTVWSDTLLHKSLFDIRTNKLHIIPTSDKTTNTQIRINNNKKAKQKTYG